VSSRLASFETRCSPAVRGGPGQIRPSSSIAHSSSARNRRPFARSDSAVVDFPDSLTPSTRSEVPAGSTRAAPCRGPSPTSEKDQRKDRQDERGGRLILVDWPDRYVDDLFTRVDPYSLD
jgi:hypothetical protein